MLVPAALLDLPETSPKAHGGAPWSSHARHTENSSTTECAPVHLSWTTSEEPVHTHACVYVRSLSCHKPPQPHGVGSSSGGLYQTKPLCSTSFFQLRTPTPPAPRLSCLVCQHTQASCTPPSPTRGKVGTTTWLPPTQCLGAPAPSTSSQYQGRAELQQEG